MASSSTKPPADLDTPIVDHGATSQRPATINEDAAAHYKEKWDDQQAMYIGLRYPEDRKKRKHRSKKASKGASFDEKEEQLGPATPPSERVVSILGREDVEENEDHQAHEIFCEMEELKPTGANGEMEWRESARWIRFEEDVEEGGERWSKPHVATLSLHSLFELRKGLSIGTVLLDIDATNLLQVIDLVISSLVAAGQLDTYNRDKVCDALLTKHRSLHQRVDAKQMPMIRSLADIGRKMSAMHVGEHKDSSAALSGNASEKHLGDRLTENSSKGSLGGANVSSANMSRDSSGGDIHDPHKFNQHFLKKIPAGAEASNILVGEVEGLSAPVFAFVRLQKAVLFGDITEVPVPTRFMFILLGTPGNQSKYREIGRSIATLMSDEVFHDVAYKARNRSDLLAGIDEFLDCVTVLPPGEWDPTIRIEPPKSVPSQEKRKKPGNGQAPGGVPNGKAVVEEEHEEHCAGLERTGRIFGGLIKDVKLKAKWYLSDYTDALHMQCVAAVFFMYFACLSPIITFGGLLGAATDNYIAAMESLVSGAICGISYHLFAGQPLTIIGSTGPVLVFESIVFRFCRDNDLVYLEFRFWIGMWLCFFLLIMVAFDLSALVRYITRFTEECFAMLIAVIFIYEAFAKLFAIESKKKVNLHPNEPLDYSCFCNMSQANVSDTLKYEVETSFDDSWSKDNKTAHCEGNLGILSPGCSTPHYVADVFFFSCLIFLGTFALSFGLKNFRNTRFFPNWVRAMLSDFAVLIAIFCMVAVDYFVGLDTNKLLVPLKFQPTKATHRGWLVNPFGRNPWWCFFAGLPPALLATILIFMDQQITAVIINRKEHKLKKGSGYHLDLLLITLQIGICTVIGTPWFVAATVLSINHVRSLTKESESAAPGEQPKFLGIREQRVTGTLVFILVGLSAFMAQVLKHVPMAVLYGVFLYMGVSTLKGIQFVQRVMVVFMPAKYQPDYMFLRNVPASKVHLFTLIQTICLAGLCVIKEIKSISIIFPIMVLAMCFIRKALDYVFTQHDLKWLDDIMPDAHNREKEEKRKKMLRDEEGDPDGEHNGPPVPEVNVALCVTSEPMCNISDEISKTSSWRQLGGDESESKLRNRKPTAPERDIEKSSVKLDGKNQPVRFRIADDDEEAADETTLLNVKPPPYILIESPSSTKITDSGSSPTPV